VRTDAGWRDFQQFMIRDRAAGVVRAVMFASPAQAHLASAGAQSPADSAPKPTPEVLAALADARAVIVGPSNPVISIWPILHVLGDTLAEVTAPVVCVSPIVGGEVVKGPTAAFLAAYDQPVSAAGVVAFYEQVAPDLLDGIVADESTTGLATLEIDTNMPDVAARARIAEQTLTFAAMLSG
jgi:LPPG:FO 2-phospho-L-lactate transferase